MRRHRQAVDARAAFGTAAVGASLLFAAMAVGMLWLALGNSRAYLERQLGAHAQQTATLLGMTVADKLAAGDDVAVDTSAGVIYDRGYYAAITITAPDGNTVSDRRLPGPVAGVPAWFTRLVHLQPPTGNSLVTRQWRDLGRITVASHPQFAYLELWHTAFAIVLGLGAGYLVLLAFLHRLLCRADVGVHDVTGTQKDVAGMSTA